ncbi:hypothetical protein NET03_02480 [Thermomicrobium sp. CFH 73360]|uniref:hypothetical protein n=1 Tax=Thermomicrobium sp. CFH 73360 TaxID=2951987 RepID=UPI0020767281|nr:hypothetical protein [Thermomicrobium sp. CFH 73360]MCM8745392.1 hypothetical protein [Thermomicrobium sp. CFH 73360]
MTTWALIAFICGLWWTLATLWRLTRPMLRPPLWLALLRDVVPAPLLGLLLVRLVGIS